MPHDVQDEVVAPDLFFSYGDVVRREVAFLRQAVLEQFGNQINFLRGITALKCFQRAVPFSTMHRNDQNGESPDLNFLATEVFYP